MLIDWVVGCNLFKVLNCHTRRLDNGGVFSTIPYIPADAMALSIDGERSFKAMDAKRWKAFANRTRLPEAAVINGGVRYR